MNNRSLTISAGPCKHVLSNALVMLIDRAPIEVEFTTKEYIYRVVITGMEMEDGSRESWYLKGRIVGVGIARFDKQREVKIYFNTHRRSGTLTYLD